MISIRQGMFETNSSSTHSFIYSKNGTLSIPKELSISSIKYNNDLDEDSSIIDRIGFFYTRAAECGQAGKFLAYLKSKGIILIDDKDYKYDEYMCGHNISEKDLDNIIFNNTTKYLYNSSCKLSSDEQKVSIFE